MSAPLKALDGAKDLDSAPDLTALMTGLGAGARRAARVLALAPSEQKDAALAAMATAIRANAPAILAANAEDVAEAKANGSSSAFVDRLALNDARIKAMADGIDVVRTIPDPVGIVTETWTRPNGMTIERVRVPLGVVGVIFESRPNVAADAGALCLKSGNARQRGDPAWRLGQFPLLPRDPSVPHRRSSQGRTSRRVHLAGAHPRPRSRRLDACRA